VAIVQASLTINLVISLMCFAPDMTEGLSISALLADRSIKKHFDAFQFLSSRREGTDLERITSRDTVIFERNKVDESYVQLTKAK
jgi:hypothetical protein